MIEFIYNNIKNTNTKFTSFKLNCRYYLYISYKNNINSCSRSKLIDKLATKVRNLIAIYKKNLHYI